MVKESATVTDFFRISSIFRHIESFLLLFISFLFVNGWLEYIGEKNSTCACKLTVRLGLALFYEFNLKGLSRCLSGPDEKFCTFFRVYISEKTGVTQTIVSSVNLT